MPELNWPQVASWFTTTTTWTMSLVWNNPISLVFPLAPLKSSASLNSSLFESQENSKSTSWPDIIVSSLLVCLYTVKLTKLAPLSQSCCPTTCACCQDQVNKLNLQWTIPCEYMFAHQPHVKLDPFCVHQVKIWTPLANCKTSKKRLNWNDTTNSYIYLRFHISLLFCRANTFTWLISPLLSRVSC